MSIAKHEIFLVIFYKYLPNDYFFELYLAFFAKKFKKCSRSGSQQIVNAARKESYNSAVDSLRMVVKNVHHMLSALVCIHHQGI